MFFNDQTFIYHGSSQLLKEEAAGSKAVKSGETNFSEATTYARKYGKSKVYQHLLKIIS